MTTRDLIALSREDALLAAVLIAPLAILALDASPARAGGAVLRQQGVDQPVLAEVADLDLVITMGDASRDHAGTPGMARCKHPIEGFLSARYSG